MSAGEGNSGAKAIVALDEVTSTSVATLQTDGIQLECDTSSNQLEREVSLLKTQIGALMDSTHGIQSQLKEVEAFMQEAKAHMMKETNVACPATSENLQSDSIELESECAFQGSTWDAMVFIFHPAVGKLPSVSLCITFLLMIVVLVVFSIIAFEDFAESSSIATQLASFRQWRLDEAHKLSQSDSTTTVSLAARVCNGDNSLPNSALQSDTVGDLQSYLPPSSSSTFGLDAASSASLVEWVSCGPVLVVVALTVWYLTLLGELRQIISLFLALGYSYDRHASTRVEIEDGEIRLRSVGTCRLAFSYGLLLFRFCMCSLLCYTGTLWIVHTIGMQDILLNCTALAIMLDLPSLFFGALVPVRIASLLDSMSPMKLPTRSRFCGMDLMSAGSFALLIGMLLIAYISMLGPFVEDMNRVYDVLCGGDLNLVVAVDALGNSWVSPSLEYGEKYPPSRAIPQNFLAKAVYDVGMKKAVRDGFIEYGGFQPTRRTGTISESYAMLVEKTEHVWFNTITEYPSFMNGEAHWDGWRHASTVHLRALLGNSTATCDNLYEYNRFANPFDAGTSCYHTFLDHVDSEGVNRVQGLCPHGCGCYSPWFGTIFKNLPGSCPKHALSGHEFQKELRHFPCEDPHMHMNLTLLAWIREWVQSPEVQVLHWKYHHYWLHHEKLPTNTSSKYTPWTTDPTSHEFCKELNIIIRSTRWLWQNGHTAVTICPVSSGCKAGKVGGNAFRRILYCPTSCLRHHSHHSSNHDWVQHHHGVELRAPSSSENSNHHANCKAFCAHKVSHHESCNHHQHGHKVVCTWDILCHWHSCDSCQECSAHASSSLAASTIATTSTCKAFCVHKVSHHESCNHHDHGHEVVCTWEVVCHLWQDCHSCLECSAHLSPSPSASSSTVSTSLAVTPLASSPTVSTSLAVTSLTTTASSSLTTTATLTGSMTFTSAVLTMSHVENSTQTSLAQEFGIDVSQVTVAVVESRRLDEVTEARRLAGTWRVTFSLRVPSSVQAVATSKASAIQSDPTSFNQAMKTNLLKLGVNATDAAITVSGFAAAVIPITSTTATPTTATVITSTTATTTTATTAWSRPSNHHYHSHCKAWCTEHVSHQKRCNHHDSKVLCTWDILCHWGSCHSCHECSARRHRESHCHAWCAKRVAKKETCHHHDNGHRVVCSWEVLCHEGQCSDCHECNDHHHSRRRRRSDHHHGTHHPLHR